MFALGGTTSFIQKGIFQPAFQEKYGQQLPDGTYEISASWQAGLSNGASMNIVAVIKANEASIVWRNPNRSDR
jgi:hypothetical protein